MLLTDFIQRDATCLPSPEQLKRKIILKVKKKAMVNVIKFEHFSFSNKMLFFRAEIHKMLASE